MRIYVDGKEAVLKDGSSFEYVSENPLFTEAEGYSLEIEFPLKDQPENILIFGALHVQGVDIKKVTIPCELDAGTFRKTGILTIVSVSEVEVKGQFLEGWSQMNYEYDLPNLYISDLDYSSDDGTGGAASVTAVNGNGWTDLNVWVKDKEEFMESRHIYLYHLLDLVMSKVGWSVDKSCLTSIPFFNGIIVVNVREHRSGEYRRLGYSLPRWTVKQFLTEIGNFFGCVYVLDSNSKRVTFVPLKDVGDVIGGTEIPLKVNDDFEVEMSENDAQFKGSKKYVLPSECNEGNVNTCPHALTLPITHVRWTEFKDNIRYGIDGYISPDLQPVRTKGNDVSYLHNLALDDYNPSGNLALITSSYDWYRNETNEQNHWKDNVVQLFEIINQYGGYTEGEELGIAPCVLVHQPNIWNPSGPPMSLARAPQVEIPEDGERGLQYGTPLAAIVAAGAVNAEDTYYKKLWMVLRDSTPSSDGFDLYTRKIEPKNQVTFLYKEGSSDVAEWRPYTANITQHSYNLSPYAPDIQVYRNAINIDETQLYRYKFLGTTIPSPTSVFLINGQKFACLRITAHFTPTGMSELLEGEFYKIIS